MLKLSNMLLSLANGIRV